jgi:hypothetical protein
MKCHLSRHADNMVQFRARLGRRQALRLDSAGFYPQAKASINVRGRGLRARPRAFAGPIPLHYPRPGVIRAGL